ncbi:hypothetical protein J0687_24705, partial [Vibrio alginolyticus]
DDAKQKESLNLLQQTEPNLIKHLTQKNNKTPKTLIDLFTCAERNGGYWKIKPISSTSSFFFTEITQQSLSSSTISVSLQQESQSPIEVLFS